MKIITEQTIRGLNISPLTCISWIKESCELKQGAQLPVKSAVKPSLDEFFTSMPCLLPSPSLSGGVYSGLRRRYYGIKVVHRLEEAVPSLGSDLLLYDAKTGELLALVEADWITAMRTGALAAAAAKVLRKSDAKYYGFIGLGNTARATLLCLLEQEPQIEFYIKLLKYKDQADIFAERFKQYPNTHFETIDSIDDLASNSDVLFSCVTFAGGNLIDNVDRFKPGITIIPVHTKGFMNCDLVFDRVFGDDTNHVSGFKYFKEFKGYNEIGEVFAGQDPGRESDNQRIINYNYGLGLHDVVYASKLYELLEDKELPEVKLEKETRKFWL